MTTLYKVLHADGRCCHGGTGRWLLPQDDQPGDWMPRITEPLVACQVGYHVCRLDQLLDWLGPAVFEVEAEEPLLDSGDKLVTARARLLRRTAWDGRAARLFAADCAERVLPIFETARPGDDRPRRAIAAARVEIDAGAAAWAAAGDAAGDAAWAGAQAAAWAARAAAGGVWDTAKAAARAAAWDAAGGARAAAVGAWDTAWDAERAWQIQRLQQYLTAMTPRRPDAAMVGRVAR